MGLVIGCGPPADAAAITISTEAPAGWRAEDTVVLEGQRWVWRATWPEHTYHELGLPVGRPVKLEIRSGDVEHRLQFPTLGLDVRTSPDRPAEVWVTMQRAGEWRSRCVQECVDGKPEAMTLQLQAMSAADHEAWLTRDQRAPEGMSQAAWGLELYRQLGCATCHQQSAGTGPPLAEFWGSEQQARDGRKVKVEGEAGEALVRRSMLAPAEFPLMNWPQTMPSYQGQLNDAKLAAIVALIRCMPARDRPECAGLPALP
jgi:cytochrome c oxidase subunit 2